MATARFLDRTCLTLRASGLWLRYATLQNFIPSFPWIAPGWRAWGRNPRKGRHQILPSGNHASPPFLYASHPIWSEHSHETPGAITAQKSEDRAAGGDCDARRGEEREGEKEEITLYCILVNWRGGRLVQLHSRKKERPTGSLSFVQR